MDKEDVHLIFQGLQIIISFIGFLVIIFKGGKYIGTNDTKMAQLIQTTSKHETDLMSHITNDQDFQDQVMNKLTDLRILVASKKND